MNGQAITTKDLTKNYGDHVVVDSLNLSIGRSEVFGLLGPNGAGKTTLLMMLSTLVKPSSGNAYIKDYSIISQPEKVRSSIGMVFQDPSSDELLSGYENLKLHALMYDVPYKTINKKIDSVLALVDLTSRKNDQVKKYSGGMRRRLEIARGLLHEPEVLFLDEPTLGLDPQTREHIWKYIESLAKNTGMTIVLTTHYMEEAQNLCDRVAIIDNGKIIALDTPATLCSKIGSDTVIIRGKNIRTENFARYGFIKGMESSGSEIIMKVENAGKNLQAILKEAGDIDYINVHSPDLNDVFLAYTGKQMREGEGGVMEHVRTFTTARQSK
ncbi:MAG: ATP-binding cassette domain-containing protein [Bacteroidia bacterium]|nr:ATP-binding cassette domain-containing protein [Bacteroidia bacterium]